MNRLALFGVSLTAAVMLTAGTARADDPDSDGDDKTIGAGASSKELPPPRSDNDPTPTPAGIDRPSIGVVKQAGIGGETAYGRAGVLELGGSMSYTGSEAFTNVMLTPSFGWFITDNFELSALLQFSHVDAEGTGANFFSALAEPSLHIPLTDALFAFAGVGAGVSWVEGPGTGFALAPRVGLNVMIGRSGILTPQFVLQYSTHDAIQTPTGSLLAVSTSYGAGLGYTVMW